MTLKRAVESILIQEETDYEIIITDDSLSDSVKNIFESFKSVTHLRYIKNHQPLGTPDNWNESIRQAKGKYIKLLHHDDWFADSSALKKMVNLLEVNPTVDFAFCGSCLCDSSGKQLRIFQTPEKRVKSFFRNPSTQIGKSMIGVPSATIFRRTAFIPFDRNFKWVVDVDFYIAQAKKNSNIAFTQEPLVCVTIESENQVTSSCSFEIQAREWLRLIRKWQLPYNLVILSYLLQLFKRATPEEMVLVKADFIQVPLIIRIIIRAWQIRRKISRIINLVHCQIKS